MIQSLFTDVRTRLFFFVEEFHLLLASSIVHIVNSANNAFVVDIISLLFRDQDATNLYSMKPDFTCRKFATCKSILLVVRMLDMFTMCCDVLFETEKDMHETSALPVSAQVYHSEIYSET